MVFVFGLAIIIVTFAYVAYPLISPRKDEIIEDEPENEFQFKKDATYSALKELEFDYALGNLSPEDHHDLEDRYKEKAIRILKDMDELEAKASKIKLVDVSTLDDIEREILVARTGKPTDLEDEIKAARGKKETRISHPVEPQEICPSCNQKVSGRAKFCSFCGAALSSVCPSCGKQVKKGNKFCSDCGAKLS